MYCECLKNFISDHLLQIIGGIALISLIISIIVLLVSTWIKNRRRRRNNHHREHHDELNRRITEIETAYSQQLAQLQSHYQKQIDELRSEIAKSPASKAGEQPQGQPLSKTEQKNLDKQQQRENNRHSDPKKPTVVTCPPDGADLTYFYVQGGKLVPDPTMSSTYISFIIDNIRYYSLNQDKIGMAISNHNSQLDPFCEKTADSVDPLAANNIKIKECGTLDQNNAPIKKLQITYKK